MGTFKCFVGALIFTCLVTICSTSIENGGGNIVCYYHNTSYFPPSEVPYRLCTHVIYAFGSISNDTIVPEKPGDLAIYDVLVGFKKWNPKLKVLLSLQHGFPSVVTDTDTMKRFATNAIGFLRHYHFDGVDFDWEFPKLSQKSKFMQFIQIFRDMSSRDAKLRSADLLLISMALGNNKYQASTLYDYTILNKNIDFATIMAYDFHMYIPNVDNITGYNSALVAPKGESPYYSTSGLVKVYLALGLAPEKTLVGIPTYGRSYTLANAKQHGLHAPAVAKGDPGPVRRLRGVYTYTDSCAALKLGAVSVWDSTSGVPYLYKGKTWVSYANEKSVAEKVRWAVSKGLGGVGVWATHLDDLTGECPGPKLPLINAIHSAMKSTSNHEL
ncbi:acidic mammalian chitinase-like [Gigantopelta aegis]|uniref:acidic mammalian chitinase-like n=1 Tax=Gigantopelta aegis TaxID=1735272 RepID=UPI001B889D92|nr:acidic mammalian chitinase-like [Gigantopelta aegis]